MFAVPEGFQQYKLLILPEWQRSDLKFQCLTSLGIKVTPPKSVQQRFLKLLFQ